MNGRKIIKNIKWPDEVKEYCKNNGLDFEKPTSCSRSWNDEFQAFQYVSKEPGKVYMLDGEGPAPIVLMMVMTSDGLKFTQGPRIDVCKTV